MNIVNGTIIDGLTVSGFRKNGFYMNGAVKNGNVFWKIANRIFAGFFDSEPLTGQDIYDELENFSPSGEQNFSITANGTGTSIVIALPIDKFLKKVVTSNNETLYDNAFPDDGNFKLSTSIVTLPNSEGEPLQYNIYIMKTILPFSNGIIFNISLV